MKEYNGEEPQNARINIKYTGKKPKVSFSYPIDKKNSKTRGSMFTYILMIWLIVFGLVYLGYSFNESYNSVLDENYENTALKNFTLCAIENSELTLNNYTYVRNDLCEPDNKFWDLGFLIILMFIFIPPCLIYFPFRKKWNKLYPDFEAFLASKKYRKLKEKDIIEYNGKIYLEIPVFKNVICDFNATEDFSKYLEEFDISEHNFYYYKKSRFKNKNKNKIKKRRKNEFLYYARWYFKQKPKKGYLEVIYK